MSVNTEPTVPTVLTEPAKGSGRLGVTKRRRLPPSLTAWLVLLSAFSLFCLLVYIGYNLVSDYLSHSVQNQTGVVQVVKDHDDNIAVLHNGQTKETLVNDREIVGQGDEIRTDKSSNAQIVLFDDSRIDLAPGSRVRLEKLQVDIKKFRISEESLEIQILDGSVRFTVAALKKYNQANIKALLPSGVNGLPPAQVLIDNSQAGTYLMTVSRSQETGVRVWLDNQARRSVEVRSNQVSVQVEPGQRVAVTQGQLGQPGRPGEQPVELINNGSFLNGIDSWAPSFNQTPNRTKIEGLIHFDAERIEDGVQPRTRIFRLDPKAIDEPSETSLSQSINVDVSEYSELWFSIKVKLVSQSLPGGGEKGVEYPVFVKIEYVDTNGNTQQFFHGFYSKAADNHNITQDALGLSSKVPQDDWQEWRLNLMDNLNRPARILRMVVGSSGHLYDSYFTDVSLIAR